MIEHDPRTPAAFEDRARSFSAWSRARAARYARPMRRFTLVQDIATDPENHWRLFLDPEFDRAQYLRGFGFPAYEILEHKETADEVVHRIRVTPKLDLPAVVAKALGPRFAYTEDGTFDKK